MFDEKIKRLSQWARKKKAPPTSIELIPTDRCNSNCLTCWRKSFTQEQLQERYKQEMSDTKILRLIDEAAEIGVREIAFVGGGEPLKREVTFQLMKKIKEYGMEGDLVTNGTLFTKEYIEMMVKNGWNRVKFSVDGPDAKTHDFLRGIKCFEIVIKNIKTISKLKKKFNVEKPRLILNTVISDVNYRSLPKIVKLAKKIGIEEILLLPMTAFADSMRDMKLTEEETRKFLDILRESIKLTEKLGVDNNFSNFLEAKFVEKTDKMDELMMKEAENEDKITGEMLELLKGKIKGKTDIISTKIKKEYPKSRDPVENFRFLPCFDPWHHITIIANGNIAPCFSPWVWETNISIKDYSLKELWYGEYFDKFRRTLLTRKLPESCATCCVWKVFENKKIRDEIDKYMRGNSIGQKKS